jgi:hypothetical protein
MAWWTWSWGSDRLYRIEQELNEQRRLLYLLLNLEEMNMAKTHDELMALAQKARAKVKELAGTAVELSQGYEDLAAELEAIAADAQSGIDQSNVTGSSTGAGSGSKSHGG